MAWVAAQAGRIIPARAGFTGGAPPPRRRPGDHPRSRGVYTTDGDYVTIPPGSSPLARGLPIPPSPDGAARGIIPARAGFTPRRRTCGSPTGDHPRSRGVYSPSTGQIWSTSGSSPLARGLLVLSRDDSGEPGIIPARAGFTDGARNTAPVGTDHPRSRGVYRGTSYVIWRRNGSSPLARGLLTHRHHTLAPQRIIPARAGFTFPATSPPQRSGIIPARAGFT